MVARTPPKQQKKMVVPLNSTQVRETVNKVDKCMARLQELQYTVAGGTKVISGVSLSPRSTRGYLRTSLRCKQETLRIKNSNPRRSSPGKFPTNTEEWRRMSLPAMLVGETVGEIIKASQFARETVESVSPKTPGTLRRNHENSELRARRKREKQNRLKSIRSESELNTPSLQRARSRINFKVSSPPKKREKEERENNNGRYLANRVSPKNRPWARKTVIFPNPLFHSSTSPTSHRRNFSKTTSPVITGKVKTPHKFLIKSPPTLSVSPTRPKAWGKKSPPKVSTAAKLRRSFSPSRLATRLVSPLKTRRLSVQRSDGDGDGMLRRSFSPSRLATKLVSPLKSRRLSVQRSDGEGMKMKMMMSGLRQRPISTPMQFSARRI